MNAKRIIPMLLAFLALQGIASEPVTSPLVSESRETVLVNDTVKPPPAKIHGSVFIATPTYFSYNFTQGSIYYTPAIMAGLDLSYKKLFLDFAAFAGKEDMYGVTADLMYSLRAKPLDEGWVTATAIIGEVSYFPAQQGIPDMTAYTIGVVQSVVRPFSWGTICLAVMLGAGYMEGDISLSARVMVNATLPVF